MLSHLLPCQQVPKPGPAPPRSDVAAVISDTQGGKRQQAYKTEIIGGVVVHTPIQVIKSGQRSHWRCERFAWMSTVAFILSSVKHCATAWPRPPKPLCVSSGIFEDGSYMIASVILKTVMTKRFRMRAKSQRGRRGRAPGQAWWGAVTVSNREMWWVPTHYWLAVCSRLKTARVETWNGFVSLCLPLRGRAGRGGFSLWMIMRSATTSLRWWRGFFFFILNIDHFLCDRCLCRPYLNGMYLCCRIRSRCDPFH